MDLKRRYLNIGFMPLLALVTGCYSPSAPQDKDALASQERAPIPCITPEDEERMANQVLQLVNLHRAAAGVAPVVENPVLVKIGSDYACRMITQGFFGHHDPTTDRGPGKRAVAARYTFYAVGENLAAGQHSAAEVMRVWMESPSHHDNILDPRWKDVGVGVRTGGEYGTYWVLEFGDPARSTSRS